jgi:hypothetical protein
VIWVPHVAISHVIGTITLLVLLAIVVVISTTLSAGYESGATQSSLQEVSSYVSDQIISMASLISSMPQNNFTAYKILELPPSIGMTGYSVSVVNDSTGCWVMAFLDNNPRLNANASLSFPGGYDLGAGVGLFPANFPIGNVIVTEVVHSGEGGSLATAKYTAVIVFQSLGGKPLIGIGVSSVGRNL